jgi:hypothetical protein
MQKTVLLLALISLISVLNSAFAESEKEADVDEMLSGERAAYLDPEQKNQLALANTLKDYETTQIYPMREKYWLLLVLLLSQKKKGLFCCFMIQSNMLTGLR